MTDFSNLDRYIEEGFEHVRGWCRAEIFQLIKCLWEAQDAHSVEGSICELGVFEGKFFCGLNNLPIESGKNLVIDAFDRDEWIADGTSGPRKKAFLENVEKFTYSGNQIEVIQSDTMQLGAHEVARLIEKHGKHRLISVDAGHLCENVHHDFWVAEELLSSGGLVFFDDYYNPRWPGVLEAIHRRYIVGRPRIAPLVFGYNKLICCTFSSHATYVKELKEVLKGQGFTVNAVKMFGYDALTVR